MLTVAKRSVTMLTECYTFGGIGGGGGKQCPSQSPSTLRCRRPGLWHAPGVIDSSSTNRLARYSRGARFPRVSVVDFPHLPAHEALNLPLRPLTQFT